MDERTRAVKELNRKEGSLPCWGVSLGPWGAGGEPCSGPSLPPVAGVNGPVVAGIPVFPGGGTPFGSPASVWGVCEEGERRLLGAGGGSGLGGPEIRGD